METFYKTFGQSTFQKNDNGSNECGLPIFAEKFNFQKKFEFGTLIKNFKTIFELKFDVFMSIYLKGKYLKIEKAFFLNSYMIINQFIL